VIVFGDASYRRANDPGDRQRGVFVENAGQAQQHPEPLSHVGTDPQRRVTRLGQAKGSPQLSHQRRVQVRAVGELGQVDGNPGRPDGQIESESPGVTPRHGRPQLLDAGAPLNQHPQQSQPLLGIRRGGVVQTQTFQITIRDIGRFGHICISAGAEPTRHRSLVKFGTGKGALARIAELRAGSWDAVAAYPPPELSSGATVRSWLIWKPWAPCRPPSSVMAHR
jgi:hypothetical protein